MNADDRQALIDVAQYQFEVAASYLQYIEDRYHRAIQLLHDAIEHDPAVAQAREDYYEARELLDSAREIAKEN